MGSKSNHASSSGPLKRKREPGATESSAKSEYYFAKYLTSPELLDLEVRNVQNKPKRTTRTHLPADRRHALPTAVPVPAAHSPPPLTDVHEDRQGDMVDPAQPLAADRLHARGCRRTVGAGDDHARDGGAAADRAQRPCVRRDGAGHPRAREELGPLEERAVHAVRPRAVERGGRGEWREA